MTKNYFKSGKKVISIFALICFLMQISLAAYAKNLTKTSSNLVQGRTYYGFKLETVKQIDEVESTAMIFKHQRSGARLLYLKNEDSNKVFSIAFRTPPTDDTGVNHIIEHSVLCGSKKYPVKDPFIIMNKQSLSTFLNALTMPDQTMYPVASRNDKDFKNLMSIYLDAVFYPNMLKNENIFKQEGWHYELNSKDDELKLNGIVYNEMKGATSSPDEILNGDIYRSLFPDSIYKWNSGGDPNNIPDLTYENFIKTYKRNYHPANSYIYLYGNMNIMETLKSIDSGYLSKFDKKDAEDVDTSIKLQPEFKEPVTQSYDYAAPKDGDVNNKTYLSLNYVVDTADNKETAIAMDILNAVLIGTDASPLKIALKQNGIGEAVSGSFIMQTKQPVLSFQIRNTNEDQQEKFKKVTLDTLNALVKQGIDKNLITSILNSVEINKRTQNSNTQRGLNYDISSMLYWIYDSDPTGLLEIDSVLEKIKSSVNNGYFENLIKKYILDNKHSSLVILKPKKGLLEENDQKLKDKLAKYKASLSEQKISELVSQTEDFKKWTSSGDSKEALSKMPTLSREDLDKNQQAIPITEKKVNDVKVLYHPIYTNGIGYTNLYFDASTVPQDKLQYLALLGTLLGRVDTEKHNFMQLSNELFSSIGGLSFNLTTFGDHDDPYKYSPKMDVMIYTTTEKLGKAYDLLSEVINTSKFDNKEYLRYIIKELKSMYEAAIANDGLTMAMLRLNSYNSDRGKYEELTQGISFYNFINNLDKNFDSSYENLCKNLQDVSGMLFNKNNLVVSFTGSEAEYSKFEDAFKPLSDSIKNEKLGTQNYKFDKWPKNEGIMIPSKVQYVTKGGIVKLQDKKLTGAMMIVQTILNNEYLWNELRTKGGAYGGGFTSTMNGRISFYSYRDPNLKETLGVFDKTVEFLKNFRADRSQMTNYIIGTIASFDAPMSPDAQGVTSDSYYFTGTTDYELQETRNQILRATDSDIRECANLIEDVLKQNIYDVVGDESKINQNKDIFDTTVQVFN